MLVVAASRLPAQAAATAHLRAESSGQMRGQESRKSDHDRTLPPAVFWLLPLSGQAPSRAWPQKTPFVLLQKGRMFTPHLLVVPVGATVSFPNADPFFHNVFSLFDGKRFDLGLYEQGSSKTVTFNRAGVSYLFCNIHPMMSAVVLALSTPFWSMATPAGALRITDLPAGNYEAHLWVEGEPAGTLDRWTHRVTLHAGDNEVGDLVVSPSTAAPHTNKFGQPYAPEASPY